ncbi:MAG: Ig-like domain-containing protein, partial [Thermoplasmata archaeon]
WYIDDVVVYVSTETTVFGPELRLVSAMVHNASVQVNWTYMFENTSYYRVVVTTSLPDDLDHGNDERSIVIEVVDYLPSILLVDDGWRNEEDYYRASLELNGYDYDLTYPFEDLSWYSVLQQYEIIVWATSGSLSRMEQSSLSSYLEGEGRLFISGEDIGYFLVQVGMGANFYHEYLHATYLRDDTGAVGIVGIPNDPISNGLPSLGITGYWPSEIAPRDDFSSAVFRYAGDGNASIKAYTGTHKVVYLACNFFEGPEAIATKATVMDRIIKWLRLPNQPPQITYYEPPGAPVIDEGENQRFNITAYDPDGTKPMIQWTLDGLAVGNEESYTFNTNYTSSGQHVINVTITDGQLFDYHEWVLTVNNVNRPPTIDTYSPTDNPTITEEQSQLFSITASDPDGDPVTIEWYLNGSHIENGSSYTFIADYESAGVHEVIVVVSDGNLTDSHSWLLTVVNVNRPPTIDFFYPENDPNITEEQSQLFLATASDADGDLVTIEWYLDGGFVQNGSQYAFVADYGSAGRYEVLVVVSDGYYCAYHIWNLTVADVIRPPQITSVTMVGLNLEDVKITWALSPDDPISVTHYEVYYGTVYRENMSGYQLLGVVPSGTDSYVHNQAGAGDSSSYFYYVIAVGSSNNSAPSRNQGGKFTRTLSEGPNLVSVPLVQSDENIEAVLQTVRFNKAWTYDSLGQKWRWYMSFKTHKGSLKTINHTMGVWVNVTEDCNLTAAGLVPSTGLIQLRKGWNLVSFPSFHNGYTVADVKLELGAERVEGFDPSAEPYFLRVMQDTEVLEPGIGYWINVPEDVLWNPWG